MMGWKCLTFILKIKQNLVDLLSGDQTSNEKDMSHCVIQASHLIPLVITHLVEWGKVTVKCHAWAWIYHGFKKSLWEKKKTSYIMLSSESGIREGVSIAQSGVRLPKPDSPVLAANLEQRLNLPAPQFPHLQNGDHNSTYFKGLFMKVNGSLQVKLLPAYTTNSWVSYYWARQKAPARKALITWMTPKSDSLGMIKKLIS